MTPVTPKDSPATEEIVNSFRRLMAVVFLSGTIAGVVSFAVQRFTTEPLILVAEGYETRAEQGSSRMHEDEGWQPRNGIQRSLLTVAATILASIGFAALLFGTAAFLESDLNWRLGVLWGLAGFTCFTLAPALGLPPQPPGTAEASLAARQLWWTATAIATAVGLLLIVHSTRGWWRGIAGCFCLLLPHLVGAPHAAGENAVPEALIRRFAMMSVAASGLQWIVLGISGGFLYNRFLANRTSR